MIQPLAPAMPQVSATQGTPATPERSEIGKRFEQMLWAEMLSHAGLEKAFTQSGGEGAAAFSRFIVEAIAEDLAERHPLGLSARVDETIARAAPAAGAASPETET